jgi:predicted GIY-YIG superfamily endonuclease
MSVKSSNQARPGRRGATAARKSAPRHHHSVYVVLLSRDVLYERKFVKCNPDYDPEKPCVYVGMTGQSPDVRFDKHKAGLKSNQYVRRYGQRLMPELYECYNPMPYEAALDMEIELAIHLREKGYGVWQG